MESREVRSVILRELLEPLRIPWSATLVHNLHTYSWGNRAAEPYDWARRFETTARERLLASDFEPLVDYGGLGRDAVLAVTDVYEKRCAVTGEEVYRSLRRLHHDRREAPRT
ncbi:MAG: hypothetical protein ACRD21_05485 [Vicinamibacteria bacterium]